MSLKENIIAVRELLTDPDHWCQGRMSQDEFGHYANHSSPQAASWCMMGAICRVTNFNAIIGREFTELKNFLEMCLPDDHFKEMDLVKRIEAWNDCGNRTHQEILDFLDGVIAILEPKKAEIVKEERILEDA
jgi:hypothetical protein